MALMGAKRKDITPFCLTVDKAGHDYLKTMCSNMSYEVLRDIWALPVLTALAPSEGYYQRLDWAHNRLTHRTRQMIIQLRRRKHRRRLPSEQE